MKLLTALLTLSMTACAVTDPYASQDAMIAAHKLEIADSNAAREQADIDYYESAQYRNARHANQFLAKHNKD